MPRQNDSLISLPKSIEAEQIILGKLLTSPEEYWPELEGEVEEGDFFKTAHRLIFHASSLLFRQGKAADITGVSHYLDEHGDLGKAGGDLYLTDLMDRAADAFESIGKYAEIVRRKAGMRKLALAGSRISTIGYQGNGNLGLAQEEALEILNEALSLTQGMEVFSVKEIGQQFINRLKKWRASNRKGISTGFTDLDKYIMDMEGQLIVVAGSVSMGKTLMLLNMAYKEALQGITVGVISLEMSLDALIRRVLQMANNLTDSGLMYATNDKLEAMLKNLESLPLFLSAASNPSIVSILKEIRRMVYKEGVKVIYIDYLQLIQGRGDKKRVEELGDIMREFLHIAIKEKIAIVVGSQINRQAMQTDDKRPRLWMLRSSGEIENSADVVLGLFRKGYADFMAQDKVMEVHILKNRNGKAGDVVKLACQLDKQRLNDFTREVPSVSHKSYNRDNFTF